MFFNKKPKRIFLDYASITPIDARVLEEMNKTYQAFANPSALYSEALLAKEKLGDARGKIATVLNCQKKEIIFTSGGTEGNNLALLGIFEAFKTKDFIPHFISTNIEHPSVLEVLSEIERRGGEVTLIPVGEDGIVSAKDVRSAIKENTILVSVMYVNNEIGTINPIKEIGRIVKEYKQKNKNTTDREGRSTDLSRANVPYFHTDACQASLYLSVDVLKLGIDLMTLDGIKIYGPRGIGMLYVKSDTKISPILFGGGQERGLRSGTENLSAAAGFATALEISEKIKEPESKRLTEIRDYAIDRIISTFPEASLNGSRSLRLPNNINICFPACAGRPGLDAEFAVISLDAMGISASYSSSCRTLSENSSSYVVEALGKKSCSESSLRFTLGRESKKADIESLINALKKIVK